MKLVTIVGARPQFIKAAMISRAIQTYNTSHPNQIEEFLLHTGQHYDENMSDIFFRTMSIPQPTWRLNSGSGSDRDRIGRMRMEIESILMEVRPDYVLVYGDTDSTLAGALAASKLHLPVVHVEAGLRSFNKQMPEETNRILTDHIAQLLCCPTSTAVRHLAKEGITKGVHHVGDVMYDAALLFEKIAEQTSDILNLLHVQSKHFRLCTLHRAENTDQKERMTQISSALVEIGTKDFPIVFPLHPRTRICLEKYDLIKTITKHEGILLLPPAGFLDMILLEKHAATILTDSGGIQKEAYFYHTPCVTLRDETEWVETVEAGWNQLAGYKASQILRCLENNPERREIHEYGTGRTSETILELL